jgi:hypothetical protein
LLGPKLNDDDGSSSRRASCWASQFKQCPHVKLSVKIPIPPPIDPGSKP